MWAICFLQEQLVYEKIGDNEAVYFFSVDRNNGSVYLINDLLTDDKVSYTVSFFVCVCVCVLCFIFFWQKKKKKFWICLWASLISKVIEFLKNQTHKFLCCILQSYSSIYFDFNLPEVLEKWRFL